MEDAMGYFKILLHQNIIEGEKKTIKSHSLDGQFCSLDSNWILF